MEEGFHPCINNPVANSFSQNRGMIITGSNASGKSTFLKTTAINAILAQTINTCAAKSYCGSYFRIFSSMALRDNLDGGESYYIVEIKALKRIMDAASASSDNPLLSFSANPPAGFQCRKFVPAPGGALPATDIRFL